MKTARGYVLKCLFEAYYIVPEGQKIADRGRCLKINETGRILWNRLEQGATWEQLCKELSCRYAEDNISEDELAKDLRAFLTMLDNYGMLVHEKCVHKTQETYYQIAGISVVYEGQDRWLHGFLKAFEQKQPQGGSRQIWRVKRLSCVENFTGTLLLFGRHMDIYTCTDGYWLRFHTNLHLVMCKISADGTEAEFFYDGSNEAEGIEELFYGFRTAFFYFAALHGRYAVHSASILYREKAWLFSAASGTGKSTHIKMWQEQFQTQAINGDMNLLGFENGQAVVYGIPWCGTSKMYDTKKYILGGIILLKRAKDDVVETLSEDEKQLLVSQRIISPTWNEMQLDRNLAFAESLVPHVLICRLCCTPKDNAAVVMKVYIDAYLGKDREMS